MNRVVKDALLTCERCPFTLQKGTFYNAKHALLEYKRAPFTMQNMPFWNTKGHVLFYTLRFFIT